MTKLKLTSARQMVERGNNVLLIAGDGKCLPQDLEKFYVNNVKHDAMAIGRSIEILKPFYDVLHYAEVDAEETKWIIENLAKTYNLPKIPITHTIGDVEWFDCAWDLIEDQIEGEDYKWYGSTALFAVMVGLELGYDRIVLAGCPLDSKGHWYFEDETTGPDWKGTDYQEWFELFNKPGTSKIRSYSGYTSILLGYPDVGGFLDGFPKRDNTYTG